MLIEGSRSRPTPSAPNTAYIYIRGEFHAEALMLEAAIAEAAAAGFVGDNVLGSRFHLAVHVTAAPGPTSAARRPPSSSRSRASAGCRA